MLYFYKIREKKNQSKRVPVTLSFLLILIIIGFRGKFVGIDTITYWNGFKYSIDGSKADYEILFTQLKYLIEKFSPETLYIFWTSVIALVPLFIIIKRKSINPILSCILFLIFNSGFGFYMTGIRQSIAISLCMHSLFLIDFEKRKNILLSISIIAISMLIHSSSVICLLLISASYIGIKKYLKYTLLILSALWGFSGGINLFSYIPKFESLGIFKMQIEGYSAYSMIEQSLNINGIISLILPISIFAYFIIKYSSDSPQQRIFLYSVILSNIFINTPFLPRVFSYGTILMIILLPNSYMFFTKQAKYVITIMIFLLFVFFLVYGTKDFGIEKYHTIFKPNEIY